MRHLLPALLLTLAACSADPVLLPDAGPCNGSCGAGTVCQAGACVSVDSGATDVGSVDTGGGMDAQAAPDVVDVFVQPDGSPLVDQGVDAGAVDAPKSCGDAGVDLRVGTILSTGLVTNCGACGVTCTRQQRCTNGACAARCPNGNDAMCDGRYLSLVSGERDGGAGQTFFCGACSGPGSVCAEGESCDACLCAR